MKIKRSELNNLIKEVVQNNQISKEIAVIVDQQGCDTDEAVTIYLKDNPNIGHEAVTQSLIDYPISNGMDSAFLKEIDDTVDDVLKEIVKSNTKLTEEEEDEEVLAPELDEPEVEEDPIEDVQPEDDLENAPVDKKEFNSSVQQALSMIHKTIKEPREYYSLLNGQETPEGTINYPGVLQMVVANPREKRRSMRAIFGKRIGDIVMDYLEFDDDDDGPAIYGPFGKAIGEGEIKDDE